MNTPTIIGVLLAAALLIPTSFGFNITRLLDQHPEFSNFNSMLSQTGVADAVNSRQTITILALDNSASGGINGKSSDMMKAILPTHVVLDYYDMVKLGALSKNKSAVLTTLFQSTGRANGMQGFLNVTVDQGQISFGSAVKGAQHDSKLIKVVAAQPFNISVLQVSSAITPPGLDQNTASHPIMAPPPRKVGPPPPSATPAPSSDSDAPAADSPVDDSKRPSKAPTPDSDAPASGPAAADDVADKDGKKKSGGSRVMTSSGVFLVTAAMAALVAL